MLSQFQIFHLNKLLSETYRKYYVPYFALNEAKLGRRGEVGGARKRNVSAKGRAIEPNDDDREFVSHLISSTGVSPAKALMLYYQLLGGGIHAVREKPGEPEGPKNKTFAWIENKTDPDESGYIDATISVVGSGRYQTKKSTKVRANIGSLKARLAAAGYDTTNQESLQSFLHTPFVTWRKRISEDKDAPAEAKYKFAIKPFGGDYHAVQVASSADFKEKMDTDSEFAKKVAEMAVRAASSASGIPVSNVDGFKYTSSGKSGKKTGVTDSDLDDAIQAAIFWLSSQSATSPEKLSDDDWIRQKLATGAMNHIRDLTQTKGATQSKDRSIGAQGNEKGDELDSQSDKGWSSLANDPDRYDGPPPEDPEGYVAPTRTIVKASVGDPSKLRIQLAKIKQLLKDPKTQGEYRQELLDRGSEIEDQLELMARYDKPKTPVVPLRKPVAAIPDVKPNSTGWSMGHDDDDAADAEDMMKYRRRMSAEGFTFDNYLKFKESIGATGAIYDGTKDSADFQWEGAPKSMRKIRRK